MRRFARLIEQLDKTNKTNHKVEALTNYFKEVPKKNAIWAIALLSHRRPSRPVTTTLMRQWAAELAELPAWLFEESYHIVGDLAETIALLVQQEAEGDNPSLSQCIEEIIELKTKEEDEKKSYILNRWKRFNNFERFVFNKILTGGFRIGISQKLMTRALSKAVEIDEELVNLLSERFGDVPNIEVIHDDAMNYDYNQLSGPWWIMVGNLPYNIGTRLLVKLITEVPQIHRYVVMLQDEVAERMVAMPNTKQYGSLSVLTSLFTNTKIQFNVSKNCFEPKPKILSTVVTIQRETLVDEALRLKAFEISKVAFQQKRKKIKSALREYIDEDMAEKLSLNLDLRPQELTPEDYLAIAESIQ